MHEQPQIATRRRRWPVVVGVCLASLISLVLLGAWLARGELVLGAPMRDAAGTVAARYGVDLQIRQIAPAGWTGVALHDVSIRPSGGGALLARAERVVFVPDLRRWENGRPTLASIVVEDAVLTWDAREDGAHMQWLAARRQPAEAPASRPPATRPSAPPRPVAPPRLAVSHEVDLEMVRVRAQVVALEGIDELAAWSDTLQARVTLVDARPRALSMEGILQASGLGRTMLRARWGHGEPPHASLQALQDNDVLAVLPGTWQPGPAAEVSVGSIGLAWPPQIQLGTVQARRLDLELPGTDGWALDGWVARTVDIRLDAGGWNAEARDVRGTLAGLVHAANWEASGVTASGAWDRSAVEMRAALHDPAGGRADAHAVWARDGGLARSLALTWESTGFDISELARPVPLHAPLRLLAGRVDGRVALVSAGGRWTWDVDTTLRDGRARGRMLTEEPIGLPVVEVRSRGWLGRAERLAWLQSLEVSTGPVRLLVAAKADLTHTGSVSVVAQLPLVDAQTALNALPEGLAPALEGLEVAGSVSVQADVWVAVSDPVAGRFDVRIDAPDVVVQRWSEAAPVSRLSDPTFTWRTSMVHGGRVIGPAAPGWTPSGAISPALFRAVVAAEDDAFWAHGGFDWRGVRRALQRNLEAGRMVAGGSTISQQLVKNLFLTHDRTLGRKLQEFVLTWLMEREVPKETILEWYVNIAHWGPGMWGVQQASQGYFQHAARDLTLRESVFLAAILPSPVLYGVQYVRSELEESRRVKMRNILINMSRTGTIDPAQLATAAALVEQGIVSAARPAESLRTHQQVVAQGPEARRAAAPGP